MIGYLIGLAKSPDIADEFPKATTNAKILESCEQEAPDPQF
jgi:hypothetical protein